MIQFTLCFNIGKNLLLENFPRWSLKNEEFVLYCIEWRSLYNRFNQEKLLTHMKTSILALLCAALCLFAACEKINPSTTETHLQSPKVATMGTLRASLTSGNWSDYQTKWVQLSPAQKYEVWMEKLAETKELPQWSSAQKAKIVDIAGSISPATFQKVFTDAEELALYESALSIFSEEQIARIFMDVYPFDHEIDLGPIKVGCTCRWSIWCGVMNTCDYGGCDERDGCGFVGNAVCKGLCSTPNGM